MSCVTELIQNVTQKETPSGCGSAWLERLVWGPGGRRFESCHPDTLCGCSSMVEHQPSKLDTWVRFPSPALLKQLFRVVVKRYESVAQLDRATAF